MALTPLQELQRMMRVALYGETPEGCCARCKKKFSDQNVFTDAGWKETKITGLCEVCFDEVTKEEEE